ncbi:hypothetical protein Q7469_12465 [Glaesserella parasuis]|uniref:Uncharacterized protein n=1 Tax=Glaesserella parasuis TaxID=738 RepID=A0AA42JGC7_GLAPU|nr:hypothetical protein [Glaesserella parasuis]KEZ13719.1 hypothetical protein HS327_02383 [Glaesserella parasuis]MDD2166791.1 hypothetical protein [Glaesserella parasuis]MDD2169127.1 hypothetical protein [Glaesserella parasuis]MDD2172072.1 hypothetical protein [Glaesserella parasuis]MDG6232092.1 hypothetical protein [Glaesserella parasuis]
MRKIFFIALSYLVLYVGFIFIEFQYFWIFKKDLSYFWSVDTFLEPIPITVFALMISIFLGRITKK